MKEIKKIAVLGANRPLINFYKRAKQIGYEIHAFAWGSDAVCKDYCDFFYPISFKDVSKIVSICKEKKIQGITSFSLESALPYLYQIAERMGWDYPSQRCQMISANKFTMREEFERCGVRVPRFIRTSFEDEKVSYFPVIVKPVDSGGSRGVTKVDKVEDLGMAIKRALSYSQIGCVLIEEYIDGVEYSVEVISFNGKHHVAAITEKVTTGAPYFVELAHFQPADLRSDMQSSIIDLVIKGLIALNYMNGPSHTEVKCGTDGIFRIIEVGLRLGGDFITSDLVRLSTGYDLVEASLDLACGSFCAPKIIRPMFSGVYFKTPQTQNLWESLDKWKQADFYIESEEWNNPSVNPKESAERQGYFIYQHTERLKLNGDF